MITREHLMFVGKKRMDEWQSVVASREPIPLIEPVLFEDKRYSVVVPYYLGPTETSQYKLKFIPIWARCYKVCHLRSTKIRLIVCDFGDRQLAFDGEDVRPANFTLTGDGVGEDAARDAETELGRLLHDAPGSRVVQSVTAYLKALAKPLAEAA